MKPIDLDAFVRTVEKWLGDLPDRRASVRPEKAQKPQARSYQPKASARQDAAAVRELNAVISEAKAPSDATSVEKLVQLLLKATNAGAVTQQGRRVDWPNLQKNLLPLLEGIRMVRRTGAQGQVSRTRFPGDKSAEVRDSWAVFESSRESALANKFFGRWRQATTLGTTARKSAYPQWAPGVTHLADLSRRNLADLESSLGPLSKGEQGVLRYITSQSLFFKHNSDNLANIAASGVLLTPARRARFTSPDAARVESHTSGDNLHFSHESFVFGRLEFHDGRMQSRFGEHTLSVPFDKLPDHLTLSLHDQQQPFDRLGRAFHQDGKAGSPLRLVRAAKRRSREWVQVYGSAPSELTYPQDFTREIFVGRLEARRGLALSFLREARRIAGIADSSALQGLSLPKDLVRPHMAPTPPAASSRDAVAKSPDSSTSDVGATEGFEAGRRWRDQIFASLEAGDAAPLEKAIIGLFRPEIRLPEGLSLSGLDARTFIRRDG